MTSTLLTRKLWLTSITAAFILASCSDETTVFENPDDNLIQEIDQLKLENSVLFEKSGVLDIYEDPLISAKRYGSSGKVEQAGDYPLSLVAQIEPPSFEGGLNLAATHVALNGDYGYVSYNTAGNDYAGAIDVINISDPNNPRLTSRLYFSKADLNSIAYDQGYLYVAGAMDAEQSITATANSMVVKLAVNNGILNTSDLTFGYQEGFNATDVNIMNNKVLVTSGQDGFLVAYNKSDMSTITEAAFADLRSVAINGSVIAVLDASEGVSFLDENLTVTGNIGISSDFGVDAKRTLDFSNDNIIVAEGLKGAGVYNITSGDFVAYLPILTNPINVEIGDIVTNGVAVNQEVILMANGAGGLSLSERKTGDTEGVGVIELTGSINYVASKGDYIFAASGRSGFQIIKLNRPSQSLIASCSNLASFSGNSNFTVLAGEELAFSGSKRFSSLTVNGSLLLCGSWTVKEEVLINDDAFFALNGNIIVGKQNKQMNIVVKSGATLQIEGNVTIHGDLILENGATVEFLGSDSVATIWGNVTKNGTVTVEGSFTDYYNKF